MSLKAIQPLRYGGVKSTWLDSLPGSGTEMLTISSTGVVSRQAIPSGGSFAGLTGLPSDNAALASALDTKLDTSAFTFANLGSKPSTLSGYGITDAQPLDSDLTAIAALTTQSYGRSLLTQLDAAAARSTLGLGTIATENGSLANYLPLAGGTLTGALNGTSISLTGAVVSTATTSTFGTGISTNGAWEISQSELRHRSWGSYNCVLIGRPDQAALIFNNPTVSGGPFVGRGQDDGGNRIGFNFGTSSITATARSGYSQIANTFINAGNIETRYSTNATNLYVYGTYTDASNYRRFSITSTTGGVFTLGVDGLGTGANNNSLFVDRGLGIVSTNGADATRGLGIWQHSSDVSSAVFYSFKSRGTQTIPTTVVNGDLIAFWGARPYDGTSYPVDMAFLGFSVSGSVSTNSVPISWSVRAGSTPGTYNTTLLAHHSGRVGVGDFGAVNSSLTQPSGQFHVRSGAAGTIGAVIQLAASATANAIEIKNSAGSVLASISSAGNLTSGAGSFSSTVTVSATGSGRRFIAYGVETGYTTAFTEVNSFGAVGITASSLASSDPSYSLFGGMIVSDTFNRIAMQLMNGAPAIGFGPGNAARDFFLVREAAGVAGIRNGVNAQTLRLYNTFTDSSNYERLRLEWSSNSLKIGTEAAGTGTVRSLEFWAGTMAFFFSTGNVSFLRSLQSDTNNAVDVGATNRRFRTLMLGTSIDNLGFEQFTEMTPPTTPAVNSCRIYAKDNGSGKTQLVVKMPDGIETVLATET